VAQIIIAPQADTDYAELVADLEAKAGHAVAERYEAAIDALYERLIDHPQSGAPRPVLGEQARLCVVRPYLVVYDYDDLGDVVTILRIIHGKRDITTRLLRGVHP
jgi:plasmid stabilization system protein ParE